MHPIFGQAAQGSGGDVLVVLTRFDSTGNIILVDMEIIGSVESKTLLLPVALDTGATFTIIPWDVAVDMGYDPADSTRRQRIFTGSGVEFCPVVTVRRIAALGMAVENIDVLCHDLPEGSCVDGLLGLNFLRMFDFEIRYSDGIIRLAQINASGDLTISHSRGKSRLL